MAACAGTDRAVVETGSTDREEDGDGGEDPPASRVCGSGVGSRSSAHIDEGGRKERPKRFHLAVAECRNYLLLRGGLIRGSTE